MVKQRERVGERDRVRKSEMGAYVLSCRSAMIGRSARAVVRGPSAAVYAGTVDKRHKITPAYNSNSYLHRRVNIDFAKDDLYW